MADKLFYFLCWCAVGFFVTLAFGPLGGVSYVGGGVALLAFIKLTNRYVK